jgi:hypothetical protein
MPGRRRAMHDNTIIMLQSLKDLNGSRLGTSDGEFGHVIDCYFDDRSWAVRYVAADTDAWLPKRQVLLSPHAFGPLRKSGNILRVNLTHRQIEDSPSIELHKPVSRQYEEEYYRYYGWPAYWQGNGLWGHSGFPTDEEPPETLPLGRTVDSGQPSERHEGRLRSALAVNGYQIEASDGTFGHVCDFLMDQRSWAICQIIVKTGHRFSGKEVQIPVKAVDRISYEESTVYVNMTGGAVEQSPEHPLAFAGAAD